MMQLIECNYCGNTGAHKVEFKYTYDWYTCKECHTIKNYDYKFWFCNLKCFAQWMKKAKVVEKGIPCLNCHETGWAFGFKSNGKCKTCHGKKKLLP